MASALNDESIEKKLQNVTNTQDGIQTLSLWVIHHKTHHKKIVKIWFKVLRKVKIHQRLTLFYLCNDVVQHARKKGPIYLDSFKTVLKEAIIYVRDASIRPSVERILKIWEERNVYKGPFIEELRSMIDKATKVGMALEASEKSSHSASTATTTSTTSSQPATSNEPAPSKSHRPEIDSKLLAEFKPQEVFQKLTTFKRYEAEVDLRSKQLSHLRLDASSIEAVKKLKDRAHGNEFKKQFEDSCVKLDDFVTSFEKEVKDRTALIEMLEQSELFYEAQYGEAKIVANAYKIFGTKLNNLKKKLDEQKKLLPDAPSPIPSPSMDAPSPGSTPTYEPNMEHIDMDFSDDEDKASKGGSAVTEKKNQERVSTIEPDLINKTVAFSIKPAFQTVSKSATSKSSGEGTLENRIASMLPNLPLGPVKGTKEGSSENVSHWNGSKQNAQPAGSSGVMASAIPVHFQSTSTTDSPDPQEEGGGTPLKDEGNSTPVQDEAPEPQRSNPIDFLTKLISQTQRTNPGSANFLQNLGILANTMKSKVEKQKQTQKSSPSSSSSATSTEPSSSPSASQSEHAGKGQLIPPQSWSAWKAKQSQDKIHTNGSQAPCEPQPAFPVLPPPVQPQLISPTGMVGAYGVPPAIPVPEPMPSVPVSTPTSNIPSLLDIALPPPAWPLMNQPPPLQPPSHPSPHPPSPSDLPPPTMPAVLADVPPPDFGIPPPILADVPLPAGPRPDFFSPPPMENNPMNNMEFAGAGEGWQTPESNTMDLLPDTVDLIEAMDLAPIVDLTSPPPPLQVSPIPATPKSILRNSTRGVLREVPVIPASPENDMPATSVSQISTIGVLRSQSASGSSQPPSPTLDRPPVGVYKPPPHPPGSAPPLAKPSSISESQQEFIDKLKRKTSDSSSVQSLPKPQVFTRNPVRPNLTTIVLTGGSDSDEKDKTANEMGEMEVEPIGAPISTIERAQPQPRFIDPLALTEERPSNYDNRLGLPVDYSDRIAPPAALPRRYEAPVRTEADYRDRRDPYYNRRAPPPRARDPYFDPYRDPPYPPSDPYGRPPPPKRPYPDPYYDHGRSYSYSQRY